MASTAQASELAPPGAINGLASGDESIAPADAVFDAVGVAAAIAAAVADGTPRRAATVAVLRDALKSGRAAIAAALEADPLAARAAVTDYTRLTDGVVRAAWASALADLGDGAPAPDAVALLAQGGYGRGDMVPFSDVDLLFLVAPKAAGTDALVEGVLYILWDLHLKVGHATRTAKDCVRHARDDVTIRTALLESRPVAGAPGLAHRLDQMLRDEMAGTASAFIEAKLAERDARHRRQGGQRYVLEPNVKEGKGGLRDLHTLFWIAKDVQGVKDSAALGDTGVFRPDEFATFLAAENFLLAVRCQLHLIAGRAMDQLTFDMQVEVARRFGYADRAGRRGVEHFMQDYFRHATAVGELTRILLTSLEKDHVKSLPAILDLFKRRRRTRKGYEVRQGRLAIRDEAAFLADPVNLIRIFEEAVRTGLLLHPDAMRTIQSTLPAIDDRVRGDSEANRAFLDTLLKHGNPERALRRMNELGVLGAFIPDFAPIVAMMQYNMYHAYTVDEHTIQCVATLSRIERAELVEELPIASRILKEGVDRKVLYLALLFHDIGKGRDEDHSVVGARIARKVAPRWLKAADVETVEWLVRHHLLMSDMAQKRDIADPRTIRDFAKAVRTVRRLDLLTVLTVCDIMGVGPGTWNNWKAQLLRALYRATRAALEGGLEDLNRGTLEREAKAALRTALDGWPKKDVRTETARHYGPYWQGLPTDAHVVLAGLLRDIPEDEIRTDVMADEDRDATRVCFALADHPGIFARLAGALALSGANVVDARTYTTKDGWATAVFWIQDGEGRPYDAARLPRLKTTIDKILKGEVLPRQALAPKDKIKKRERGFERATSIAFDNEGSEIYTIVEVDTRDRPGLLYDLARTLSEANVNIASAVVVTYGEQAVDSFYVKDMFGLKFHSPAKQAALEKRLRAAIEAGRVRADEA